MAHVVVYRAARDYNELLEAINQRRIELKMTMLDLDDEAGLQNGYSAKLFCRQRHFGERSLGGILRAVGLQLAIVPASAGKRSAFKIIPVRDKIKLNRMVAIGRIGGAAKYAKMTREEWKAFSRRGGLAKAKKRHAK